MKRRCAVSALAAAVLASTSACRNFGEPPPPSLAVSPVSFSFMGAADGQSPPTQALSIGQLGTGTVIWVAQSEAAWLSLNPANGTAPAVVWVSVTTTGLTAGTYTGTIAVSAAGAGKTRLTVPVTLDLRSVLSLTGRWVGVGNGVNLAMTLADSGGSVTGSGMVTAPLGAVTITGTHQGTAVALTMTGQDGAVAMFAGSLIDDNTILGTVSGAGFSGLQVTVFRQ